MDNSTVNETPPPIQHYENFPVASWLCPPRLRPPIAALYHYARTADDLADEGDASSVQRLADLAAYRADLQACLRGQAASGRWPHIFGPLRHAIKDFQLPEAPLADLLSAFVQDVEKTGALDAVSTDPIRRYADRQELLGYCRRSANPVGRLLLHLYGVHDAEALTESDAICTALQLINFWQDLRIDVARGRYYLTAADCTAHGVSMAELRAGRTTPPIAALMEDCCHWARGLMQQGAPLVHRLPGRMGWELRLVVQGGLRILDKIEAQGFDTLRQRPRITGVDAPLLMWRACRMRRRAPGSL